jgi:hypothetical protein
METLVAMRGASNRGFARENCYVWDYAASIVEQSRVRTNDDVEGDQTNSIVIFIN